MGDSKQKSEEPKAPTRPTKLTFMDSLRNNLKKWSSHSKEPQANKRKILRVEPFIPEQVPEAEVAGFNLETARARNGYRAELAQGEVMLVDYYQVNKEQKEWGRGGVQAPPQYSSRKRKTSFELFLSSIPKLDPVDRTVGWVLKHPDLDVGVSEEDSVRSMSAGTECNTSISRYESERGTYGRGTPPSVIEGQPRLDDLFRQFQMKQEREAKFKSSLNSQGHTHSGTSQTHSRLLSGHRPMQSSPWITQSMKRGTGGLVGGGAGARINAKPGLYDHKDGPSADILHKNSYYYNQPDVLGGTGGGNNENLMVDNNQQRYRIRSCEWESCQAKFHTVKDLHRHVHDRHLSRLPVSNLVTGTGGGDRQAHPSGMLCCRWRHCTDSTLYSARYKLMLHLQRAHFDSKDEYDRDKRDPQKLQAYFQNTNSLETKRRGSNTQYTAAMTTTPYGTRHHHPNHSNVLSDLPDPLSES